MAMPEKEEEVKEVEKIRTATKEFITEFGEINISSADAARQWTASHIDSVVRQGSR